jgi:hypothetical protein
MMATREAGRALSAALAANSSIKALNLSNNNWQEVVDGRSKWMGDGPGFAEELAAGVKANNGTLVKLNVSSSWLCGSDPRGWWGERREGVPLDGLAALAKSIANIKELNVSRNFPDVEGAIIMAEAIQNIGALETITISGSELFDHHDRGDLEGSQPVTIETAMTEADFSGKDLGASGAIMLAAFLPKCQ